MKEERQNGEEDIFGHITAENFIELKKDAES